MATRFLLPEEGHFYKANLHCHSTVSDGRLTVEELKRAYQARGYQIVAFSDHNQLVPHNELADEGFLPITAIEIDFTCTDAVKYPKGPVQTPVYHLNFFSKDKDRTSFIPFDRVYDFRNIQGIIDRANADGFLAQYNHPRWSYQTAPDFEHFTGLFAFEVYNHGCEVEMHNGWGEYEYHHFMRCGGRAAAVATDDNHMACGDFSSPHCDCFGGFTVIRAASLTYEAVLGAMERKECYASTGAEIRALSVSDRDDGRFVRLHIECSPCCSVAVLTDTRQTCLRRSLEDDIVSFDAELPANYTAFRVECLNGKHEKALSRAYFRDEIEP